MATVSAIRDGLKTRLETISGLRASDYVPEQINPPVAVIGGPLTLAYDSTMARGADRYTIPVRLFVSRVSDRASQEKLDGYLAASGAGSVKAAIEGDITLGGAVMSTRVVEARSYGSFVVGDVSYLGVEFVVDVIG